jgi:hypothetical protein
MKYSTGVFEVITGGVNLCRWYTYIFVDLSCTCTRGKLSTFACYFFGSSVSCLHTLRSFTTLVSRALSFHVTCDILLFRLSSLLNIHHSFLQVDTCYLSSCQQRPFSRKNLPYRTVLCGGTDERNVASHLAIS